MVVSLDELAKQERRMVRNDTRFLKTFVKTLTRSLTEAAPQLLVERFGLPPLGARFAGSILQGEKPATAALDAVITKLGRGELVEPSKEPFEDLLNQIGALQDAFSAFRGADKVKLLGELIRVRIGEIAGLPIDEQSGELEKLHRVIDELEGTVGQLVKARDDWTPKYAGADPNRIRNNPQWQGITEGMAELGEDPALKIKASVAAGMALVAIEKAKAELIAQGIDPDSQDLAKLAAEVIHERILARKRGEPITVDQAVKLVLKGEETGEPRGEDPADGDDPPPTTMTSRPMATSRLQTMSG